MLLRKSFFLYTRQMDIKHYIRKRLFQLIAFIFLTNLLAMHFYWYNSIWWFDIPMHFLGGVWLAYCFYFLFYFIDIRRFLISKPFVDRSMVVALASFVVCIGLLWEVFEIGVQKVTFEILATPLDSLSDLLFDLAGGLFVYTRIQKYFGSKENGL